MFLRHFDEGGQFLLIVHMLFFISGVSLGVHTLSGVEEAQFLKKKFKLNRPRSVSNCFWTKMYLICLEII